VSKSGNAQVHPANVHIGSVMQGSQGSRVTTSCLVDPNPSVKTISLKMCGNGIVDDGEECDPGQGTQSNCCDVNTCKFKSNAVCEPANSPCCLPTCSFAPATQVCRPSRDSRCDTAEFCTGNSSSCPTDVMSNNGKWRARGLIGNLTSFIIKGKVVVPTVWHVPVVNVLP